MKGALTHEKPDCLGRPRHGDDPSANDGIDDSKSSYEHPGLGPALALVFLACLGSDVWSLARGTGGVDMSRIEQLLALWLAHKL